MKFFIETPKRKFIIPISSIDNVILSWIGNLSIEVDDFYDGEPSLEKSQLEYQHGF